MSTTFSMYLLLLHCFVLLFKANCSSPLSLSPALYIFGDSLSDSGNNNFLQTLAKVNYKPYGIDFPAGATGRFTNGMTSVDFLALFLGLPLVPPYLGLSMAEKNKTVTGINYASGSAGILKETGSALGTNLALEVQIELFNETVKQFLPGNFKTRDELLLHLSKSIFIVTIGSNDYINNYLLPELNSSSHMYRPEQFAIFLLQELKQNLQDLYKLGARKFLVFNIPQIGCTPGMKTRENITSGCAEHFNQLVSLYNKDFSSMLQDLSTSLHGSTFVKGNLYDKRNPSNYGFTNGNPCCDASIETLQCLKDSPPCLDRSTHNYWDEVHPTQRVNLLIATDCFYGRSSCTPINLLHLALKR